MKLSLDSLRNLNIAAAVSGGSDSLALLFLLIEAGFKDNLTVLHFNHKFRPESDDEEFWLKFLCERLGVRFIVGSLSGGVEGNLQQAARKARYKFFKDQCSLLGLDKVCVGHTRDDVVETMLMRMGRGSGLKGLSAMSAETVVEGVSVLRPLLNFSREDLQSYLNLKSQEYLSDPSNENDKFYRIRVRKLKPVLEGAGLSYEHLYQSALSLSRANDALSFYVKQSLNECFASNCLNLSFIHQPLEVSLRVLAESLLHVTGEGLAPRTSKVMRALKMMEAREKKFTLGGAIFTLKGEVYMIEKE